MRGQDISPEKRLKEFRITCRIFFWTDIAHSNNLTLDQNCICEENPSRDTDLLQKLFWTEISTPSTSSVQMGFIVECGGQVWYLGVVISVSVVQAKLPRYWQIFR